MTTLITCCVLLVVGCFIIKQLPPVPSVVEGRMLPHTSVITINYTSSLLSHTHTHTHTHTYAACYFNRDMLMHFHPGALRKNKWTCCGQHGKMTLGCQPTYHLLTRSSSRYAQMRRRDTLTSNGSQRRLRNGSGPFSTLDRQSLTTCSHVSDNNGTSRGQGRPGQGLSNSCMNLTSTAAHRVESFVVDDARSSQRSSRVSTDHSVGVDSITLTRVSMFETTPTGFDGECEGQSMGFDGSEPSLSQSRQSSSKRHSSRSQVAPEPETNLTVKHFPLCRTHPLEMEHKSLTLPNPKSKSRKHSQRYVNSMELKRDGTPPRPVPPPRHRKPHLDSALTGSVHVISTDRTTSSEPSGCHDNDKSHDSGDMECGRMKHSHTFVVQCRTQTVNGVIAQHLQAESKNCSQSMNALSKPLIEPKFSLTNPNIVHV